MSGYPYTTKQVAEMTGLHVKTIQTRIYMGHVPSHLFIKGYRGYLQWREEAPQYLLDNPPRIGPPILPVITASDTMRALFYEAEKQGMSLRDSSIKLGLHSQTLHRWRRGLSTPDILNVEGFASLLGFEISIKPKEDKS